MSNSQYPTPMGANLPRQMLAALVSAIWGLYCIVLWNAFAHVPLPIFFGLSWDEYQYLPHIARLQDDLRHLHLRDFLRFWDDRFGYGAAFWQVYAVLSFPFSGWFLHNKGEFMLVLRLITLALQVATVFVSFGIVRRVSSSKASEIILALMLVAMPGLLLTFKPFSPDYLATLTAMLALYSALRRDEGRKWEWGCFLLLGAATAFKPYNAMMLLALFPLLRQRFPWRIAVLGSVVGFLGANVGAGLHPVAYLRTLSALSAAMNDPSFQSVIHPPGMVSRVAHWFYNLTGRDKGSAVSGIFPEFYGPAILAAIVVVSGVTLKQWRKSDGAIILLSGLAILALSIIVTNRVWTWYVLTPVFLIAIGFAACAGDIIAAMPAMAIPVMAVLAVHLWSGISGLHAKASSFFAEDGHAKRLIEIYNRCSVPVLARRDLSGDAVILSYRTPFRSVLAERICWYGTPDTCVDDGVKLLVLKEEDVPPKSRSAIAADGFSETRCVDGYFRFERR
jgi:hypothetical protein